MDVSVSMPFGRDRISAMTRTVAAQRLKSIIAVAMSFILEVVDLSKMEIFLFDEERSAKSKLVFLPSCCF